ncbi:DUF2851 family protein [Flavobacterium branchiophilum]|uniref:DUF2851 domain-containing protein n=1 Tax=Flavobacterium branchiophilum TaxID=55197 RepID=A0A2H3KEA9_9FLAO|nr:DUF2851 family protein [Flavobacterium branchiophilum]PDS26531.1 hypothetical protein B0A77_02210 [Flavobacterium branchiophilum]
MKEDFLHYIWKFKKFNFTHLQTTTGEEVVIVNVGQYLQLAGPDFFNAQMIIGQQKWAGNIEIHLKSSDWYAHHHEDNEVYQNIILHVVWEHDTEIYRKDNSEIPVLELKNYVSSDLIHQYQALVSPKTWIFCENHLQHIDEFMFKNWLERLFYERLERKSKPILELATKWNNDWETVLFHMLAKNFGLNTNGDTFQQMAQAIPFQIIRKESFEVENIEALLFGTSGLLDADKEDVYFKDMKFRYYYLLHKYQLEQQIVAPLQFFKHRPDNFPTIRISQWANVYHKQQNLFSKIIGTLDLETIYELFQVSVSDYWKTHYQFDKSSVFKNKSLTKSFIDLLIINTLVPIQFAYFKSIGKEISENLIGLLMQISPEKNAKITKFKSFGIDAQNAFESQSLLQLKNAYCESKKCLDCAIGTTILKNK